MKFIVLTFAFMLSLSSFAGTEMIKLVLDQPEITSLEDKLTADGFTLSNVKDVFAEKGIRPRCPCESLELTFAKPSQHKVQVYSVSTKGFGTSLKVTVKKLSK